MAAISDDLPNPLAERLEEFGQFVDRSMDRNGDRADRQYRRRVERNRKTPIETIYHYTNVSGALGILSSGRLWLTERRHLNDPLEVGYGLDVAIGIAREMSSAGNPKLRAHFADRLDDGLKQALDRFAFYVGSFSIDGDSLPQWRMYADDGRGVVLGFPCTAFDKDAPGQTAPAAPSTFLVRYDRGVLERYQRDAIEKTLEILEDPDLQRHFLTHEEIAIRRLFTELALLLIFNSVLFKHPAYADEAEFRVLVLGERAQIEPHYLHRVRERNGEIVQYLDRPIYPPLTCSGTSLHIKIGPAASSDLANQLETAARKCGIANCTVDQSVTPYRSIRS